MASSDKELEAQLTESGNKLVEPPSSVDELLPLLDRVESYLSKVEQSPSKSMQDALSPSLKALVADELLRHSDVDVKVAVASCISEITRITAPEAPYDDDQMKDVFKIIVSSFENLSDKSSRSYIKRTLILETVAKVRSCVVMLDLECDALILEMFQHFLKAIRDYHPENVFTSMETIMTLVLEESEDIPVELLSPILASVKNENEEVLPIARRLGERVLESCAAKVKPYLVQAVKTLDIKLDDYCKVVATICGDADDNVERSEVQASDQNMAGESNSVKPSDYEEAKEDKGMAKEDASLEKTDPSICRSPQSAMSNGIAQTGGDDSLADSSSLKKQGDDHPIENSKDLDGSSNTEPNAEPDTMSAEKAVDIDQKPEQTIEKKESESSLSLKSTPSESTHADNANEKEALSGQGGQDDDVRGSPPEGPSAEVAEALEDDKGDNGKATSPKELENESADVSSVSPSEDLTNESRSKKSGQKKKESLEKEAAPSADKVSKNVADVTSDWEVKAKRRAGKKVPAASSCEIKVSTEIDASIKDRETTSDSEAKPLKHSTRKVVKSGKNEHGSAAKQAEDEKKQVEDSEATSDSDAKPLKQSAKKVDKSSKNEHGSSAKRVEDKKRQLEDSEATSGSEAKSLKRSAKKVDKSSKRSKNEYGSSAKLVEDKKKQVEDSEATTDSEAKPLKLSAKKLDRSSKNEHAKQVEDKKKQGRGKAASEKGVTKASAKDDSKDAIASPKLPGKSTKVEHSTEETPKTNSKRKRTPGKAKESGDKDFGENIVGSKVKVWWPKDHMFYNGVIVSFDPVKKKHNVLYTDGDFETLNLKREKWEFIGDDSGSDEEEVPGRSSPDASTELPLKKKAKTKSDEPPSKQKKVEASPKRTGVASSSKSKGTAQKSGRVGKSDGKSKDDSKSVGKSENASGGKSKDQTPRSGSSKSVTIALKSSSKSKNNDAQKPKTTKSKDESSTPSSKSKQDTLKAGKSKSSTPKTAMASKDKPNQTSGKSSANGTGKVKTGSSKVKAEEDVKDNSSDSEKVPETTKGKSPNPSKGQEGDVQTGKKRRRVTKA